MQKRLSAELMRIQVGLQALISSHREKHLALTGTSSRKATADISSPRGVTSRVTAGISSHQVITDISSRRGIISRDMADTSSLQAG